jgi:hypothetical protein
LFDFSITFSEFRKRGNEQPLTIVGSATAVTSTKRGSEARTMRMQG